MDTAADNGAAAFVSPAARLRYWGITLATFLVFLTGSCVAYLSRVLSTVGFNEAHIGVVLSSGTVPVIAFTLLSGGIIGRFGSHNVACLGVAMILLGYAGLQLTVEAGSLPLTVLAMATTIGGVGLFMPAGFLLVRVLVRPEKLIQYVGIYSAMLQVPAMFGPLLAERTFTLYGLSGYFYLTAVPCLAGLLLLLAMRGASAPAAAGAAAAMSETYPTLLRRRDLRLPYLGGVTAGALFGVTQAFAALLLATANVGVHYFFTPFAAAYVITRLFLLRFVERLPRTLVVGVGNLMMVLGLAVLWAAGEGVAVVAAALVFGVGYSVTYPVAIVWVSELFPAERRPKPVAMFNAVFTFGVYASPLLAGALLRYGGPAAFYVAVILAGVAAAIPLLIARRQVAAATG